MIHSCSNYICAKIRKGLNKQQDTRRTDKTLIYKVDKQQVSFSVANY